MTWNRGGMADSATRGDLKKLECSICSKTFTDPKLLKCFHVFCKDCLEPRVLQDQDQHGPSLCCPKCCRSTPIPASGVSGLQSAFHIHHLFEVEDTLKKVKQGQEGKKIQCEKCKKREASGFCRDCGDFVCDLCNEMHQAWKEFSSHSVIGLEQLKGDAKEIVSSQNKTLYCSLHPGKELDLFCETDQELICQHCFFKTHRDHQCDLLSDVFPKRRDAITAHMESVKQQLSTVREAMEKIHKAREEIRHQYEALEAKVQEKIGQLQEALEVRKTELIGQLDQKMQDKLKTLLTQEDELKLVEARLNSCFEHMDGSLATGNEGLILAMEKPVVRQVKEIGAECDTTKLSPQEQADITLLVSSKLLPACQQFGQVYSGQVCPENCYATGKGLETATVGEQSTVTVHAVDRAGSEYAKPLTDTDDISCEFVSCITADECLPLTCNVKLTRAGEYETSYQPTHRGRHQLHIKVSDQHIRGSPFTVVAKGEIGAPLTILTGLQGPWGVAISETGQVIIAEKGEHCISIYTQGGEKVKSLGKQGSEPGQFNLPSGVAVDRAGNILVVDRGNHRIQQFTAGGAFMAAVGIRGGMPCQFHNPHGISVSPNGKVYICDVDNHRVQILNPDLTFSSSFGSEGSGDGQFNHPYSVAFDSHGNVYVADGENHRIQVFTKDGRFLTKFGKEGGGDGELNWPAGVAIDSDDVVYVAERNNHRISLFTSEGHFQRSFGTKGDGPGQFAQPRGVAVDKYGAVYVNDCNNSRLQVF